MVADDIAAALANDRFMPPGFTGLMAAYHEALATGGTLPVTLADARRSIEHRALPLGGDRCGGEPADESDHPSYGGWRR